MIEVHNLRKEFTTNKVNPGFKGAIKSLFSNEKQTKVAVNDVSFHIKKGEIVGYVGSNGAGKSTTIKIISGIITPTSGYCKVNGLIPYENRTLNSKQIGVVFGQRTQLWWDLPLSETFSILKKIYDIDDTEYHYRMNLLTEILGLNDFINSAVRTLSLGQRMRADLAASLIHNPKVLFLDEPTIGLDVIVKDKIREAIKNFRDEYGTSVMLTTHDMSDIEYLCDRILLIDKGSIIYDGDIQHLKDTFGTLRTLQFSINNIQQEKITEIRHLLGNKDQNFELISDCNKLVIKFDKNKLDTIYILNIILNCVNIKDINIIDMPIEDIIKEIYRTKLF